LSTTSVFGRASVEPGLAQSAPLNLADANRDRCGPEAVRTAEPGPQIRERRSILLGRGRTKDWCARGTELQHPRCQDGDVLLVTEQPDATELGIRVPQGNSPDRHRTNTKPQVRASWHKGHNHSYSHSHCSREPLRALPRVAQGQGRDLSRVRLPSRHYEYDDASHHLHHATRRRANYCLPHASQRRRYASRHHHASHRRSNYHHRRASPPHRRHVRHDGQRTTAQPNMPTTQPPPKELLDAYSCPSSECPAREENGSAQFPIPLRVRVILLARLCKVSQRPPTRSALRQSLRLNWRCTETCAESAFVSTAGDSGGGSHRGRG